MSARAGFNEFIRAIHMEFSDDALYLDLFTFLADRLPGLDTTEEEAIRMEAEVDRALRWLERHRPMVFARFRGKENEKHLFTTRCLTVD